MTLQTAIDITNLVCASLAFIYFAITQIVAFFVLRCRDHDERIIAKIAQRRLREGGDDVHEYPPRDQFLYDAFRGAEPPVLLLSERSGILLSVTCAIMVITFVADLAIVKHFGYSVHDNRIEYAYLGLSVFTWLIYGILPCFNAYSYLGPGILTMLSQLVTEILNHHASQHKNKDYKLWPTHFRIIILSTVTLILLGAVLQLQLNPDEPDLSTPASPSHISNPFDVRRNYGTTSPGHGTHHTSLSPPTHTSQSLSIQPNNASGTSATSSSLRDSVPVDTLHQAVFIKATPSHVTIPRSKRRLTGPRKPAAVDLKKNRDGYRMIQVEPGIYVDDSSMSGESVYLRGHSPPVGRKRAKTEDLPAAVAVDVPAQGQPGGGGGGSLSFVKSAVAAVGGQSGSLLTSGLVASGRWEGGGATGKVAEEGEGTLLRGLE